MCRLKESIHIISSVVLYAYLNGSEQLVYSAEMQRNENEEKERNK